MFDIAIPEVAYTDPWLTSGDNKIKKLLRKEKRVIYFYASPDSSTFRYRVYNMIQALDENCTDIAAVFFEETEIEQCLDALEYVDAIIFCRVMYSEKFSALLAKAKVCQVKTYYDIDDLVFNTDYVHLIMSTLDQSVTHPTVWDYWYSYIGRVGGALKLCDEVICTNDFLAEQIKMFADKPVHVTPNFLNKEQIELSNQIFQLKQNNYFNRNNHINIGYFSGTPSHNKDFSLVANCLLELMRKNDHIHLTIVGFIDYKIDFSEVAHRITRVPLQDFMNLQRFIGLSEINIVPLQDNTFTNCKSELKYFEAAVVGTTTLATPTFTYKNAICHQRDGYLVEDEQWFDCLQMVVNNFDNYSLMANKARDKVLDLYTSKKQAPKIRQIFF